jgi:hypothetical protein
MPPFSPRAWHNSAPPILKSQRFCKPESLQSNTNGKQPHFRPFQSDQSKMGCGPSEPSRPTRPRYPSKLPPPPKPPAPKRPARPSTYKRKASAPIILDMDLDTYAGGYQPPPRRPLPPLPKAPPIPPRNPARFKAQPRPQTPRQAPRPPTPARKRSAPRPVPRTAPKPRNAQLQPKWQSKQQWDNYIDHKVKNGESWLDV